MNILCVYKTRCDSFDGSDIDNEMKRLGVWNEILKDMLRYGEVTDVRKSTAVLQTFAFLHVTVFVTFNANSQ